EFYTTVRTAPSRPQRVYVAEWWFRPQITEAIYVSDDSGDTFTRTDVTSKLPVVPFIDGGLGPTSGAFYVYAVHPTDPDTLLGGVLQDADPRPSFLLVSHDKGQTWSQLLLFADPLVSAAYSADGAIIWAATSGKL